MARRVGAPAPRRVFVLPPRSPPARPSNWPASPLPPSNLGVLTVLVLEVDDLALHRRREIRVKSERDSARPHVGTASFAGIELHAD